MFPCSGSATVTRLGWFKEHSGFELQWALWAQANPGALPGQQMHAAELGEALCLRRNEVRSRLLASNFKVHDVTGFGLQGLGVLEAR